jgi:HEAT repeat protein
VRLYAAIALGEIADESAAESLNNALLNDPSADVRYTALLGIARIGSKDYMMPYRKPVKVSRILYQRFNSKNGR